VKVKSDPFRTGRLTRVRAGRGFLVAAGSAHIAGGDEIAFDIVAGPFSRSRAAQGQAGDFRRAIEPQGNQDFPDAAVDVNLRAIEAVPAFHKPHRGHLPEPHRPKHHLQLVRSY